MKYIFGITDIWKNMFIGRPKIPLLLIIIIALVQSILLINQIGLLAGLILSVSLWGFGLPSAIYIIDQDAERNSARPKKHKKLFSGFHR